MFLSKFKISQVGQPLIPGLPNDLANICFSKLPVHSHSICRTVCKLWYLKFGNINILINNHIMDLFFTRRKEHGGFHDPWLFVYACDEITGKFHWKMLDLNCFIWYTMPEMPYVQNFCTSGFKCVSIPNEGSIFVCGVTYSSLNIPLNLVMKYGMGTNRWSMMLKMNTLTSESGVMAGKIGGNSANLFYPNAYMVMDVDNKWQPILNLGYKLGLYDVAVMKDKILVTRARVLPNYEVVPMGRVFNLVTKNWVSMAFGLRQGWIGSSVVVLGHLFVLSEEDHETTKLKVYDANSDSWETVKIDDNPFPDQQIFKHFSVVGFDDKIYVVGLNLAVTIGCISRLAQPEGNGNSGKKCRFSVNWEIVVDGSTNADSLGFKPYNVHLLFA